MIPRYLLNHKLLTREETEFKLAKAQEGDIQARDYVIAHNQRLVRNVVNSFSNVYSIEEEDLFQIGNMGLTRAVSRYDSQNEASFGTFAYRVITNEIMSYVRAQIRKQKNMPMRHFADGEEDELQGSDSDEHGKADETLLIRDTVERYLSQLSESQRTAIEKRYLQGDDSTWEEIGDHMNMSKEGAEQAASRGLKKLRKMLVGSELELLVN